MKLYLVRHGESVSSDVDPEQPLSKEGAKKIECLGNALKSCNLPIEEIFHSSKLRAKQTAEILCRSLSLKIPLQERVGLKPNDPPDALLQEIASHERNLMIVSHLPFLDILLSRLLKTGNTKIFEFQAGSIVCLEKEHGEWILSWTVFPDLFMKFEKVL